MSVEPGGNIKDYALAVGRVRHMGEPVAAVCAATRELARDAADLVEVVYEPLPVLIDAEESLKDESCCTTTPARTSSGRASSTGVTWTRHSPRRTTS